MLKIKDAVALNKYGQDILSIDDLLKLFSECNILERKNYLKELVALILQSQPKEEDIETAIIISNLKATYTPCILLKNGVAYHNFKKIINLPENELSKALALLLSLFRIAYKRRFAVEKNNPDKWWYWDLSDEVNVNRILKIYK